MSRQRPQTTNGGRGLEKAYEVVPCEDEPFLRVKRTTGTAKLCREVVARRCYVNGFISAKVLDMIRLKATEVKTP
jgi:hypothetical protein